MLDFFDFRHHLRDTKKDTDPDQQKQNTPGELKFGFLIVFHKQNKWSIGVLE
jgi:hypothetical protein